MAIYTSNTLDASRITSTGSLPEEDPVRLLDSKDRFYWILPEGKPLAH